MAIAPTFPRGLLPDFVQFFDPRRMVLLVVAPVDNATSAHYQEPRTQVALNRIQSLGWTDTDGPHRMDTGFVSEHEVRTMATFGRRARPPPRTIDQEPWMAIEGAFAARKCSVLDISEGGEKIKIEDP
jgi:hypothetical protein